MDLYLVPVSSTLRDSVSGGVDWHARVPWKSHPLLDYNHGESSEYIQRFEESSTIFKG